MRLRHSYKGWRLLMTLVGMGPSFSYIEVANGLLKVVMGWSFQMTARLEDIESAEQLEKPVPWTLGVGVHGWAGEWAVNGSRRPHVVIRFAKPQRARVIGFPVKVRVLHLCPEDPQRLLPAIQPS